MSDCCIVCLGGLRGSEDTLSLESSKTIPAEPSEALDIEILPSQTKLAPLNEQNAEQELIAHLVPCGHDLHEECLKPWVERANSCPLCRQVFNHVEVTNAIGGPVIFSYSVEDRIQVEDFDPNAYIPESEGDEGYPPCPICGTNDDPWLTLVCDRCDKGCHTYCLGLDSVPDGDWFCGSCEAQRVDISRVDGSRANSSRYNGALPEGHAPSDRTARLGSIDHPADVDSHRHHTRGQRHFQRRRAHATQSGWASVWQSVRDTDQDISLREWHRARVAAAMQTSSNRSEESPPVWRESRPRPQQPKPESKEETMAWNAFEVAKAMEQKSVEKYNQGQPVNTSRSRSPVVRRTSKRRKRTFFPSSEDEMPVPTPASQPERALKRPQTRRVPDHNESFPSVLRSHPRLMRHNTQATTSSSFLGSLLNAVESSTTSTQVEAQAYSPQRMALIDTKTVQNSSPGVSPTASNYSSPRLSSSTPPSFSNTRPGSPGLLTSKVEPLYPPPEFSPERSPASPSLPSHHDKSSLETAVRNGRKRPRVSSPSASSPRAKDASPSRSGMSLEVKTEISAIVKNALQSPWKNGRISKEEYTEINRKVSRLLYESIGQVELADANLQTVGQQMAEEEVEKLLRVLHD